ncbi:hypothetical protein P8452_07114 [Trifolium repens]|nr:hypothetical protein P8452_07114 [Trifolium repens]
MIVDLHFKTDLIVVLLQPSFSIAKLAFRSPREVAEVNEFKAKVAEFDAMKEQFALIMANMQNHGSNIRSPFEVRRSSESSHNVEGDQATPDD